MRTQIIYISKHQGQWMVRRFGRALAVQERVESAIETGRRIAYSAARCGVPAELRLLFPGQPYRVEATYGP